MTRLLTAILSTLIISSCQTITGSGNIITETRNLKDINGVKSSGSIEVEVVNDDKQTVKVEADDNVMEHVITRVKNGLLHVDMDSDKSYRNIKAKVYISAPTLRRVYVSGSGTLTSQKTLTDDKEIEFKVTGSGEVDAMVDAPTISAQVTGSGVLRLSGRTKDLKGKVTGSGDLKSDDLLSENTNVTVSGSGTASVYSSVELTAKVTGSGDVFYSGNPKTQNIKKTGSGGITKK